MLYSFFGTDTVKVREKAFAFLGRFEKEDIEIERIAADTYMPGMLVDYAGAVSLFSLPQVVLVDTPSERKEVFEDVLLDLSLLEESANTFVLIEGKLLAAEKKKVTKHSKEHTELTASERSRFNTFLFADALGRRDKKSLWLLFARALREGIAMEEVIGVLFWQLKAMRLVLKTKNAGETGLKEFSYKKAKSALSKYSPEEVEALSGELVSLYHEGHLGRRDIDIALERLILTL